MFKELLKVTKVARNSSMFLGGVAFGTMGLKLLASKEAKAGYAKLIATTYKLKDGVDASLSTVKQHADDVLSDAKEMYEAEKQQEAKQHIVGE